MMRLSSGPGGSRLSMDSDRLAGVHSTMAEQAVISNARVAEADLVEAVEKFKSRWFLENNHEVNQAIACAGRLSLEDVRVNGEFDRRLRHLSGWTFDYMG